MTKEIDDGIKRLAVDNWLERDPHCINCLLDDSLVLESFWLPRDA